MDEDILKEMLNRAQENHAADGQFTPEEANRFKKAFEDPEFRKMFSEYMDEIQDPANREETEAYISQLESEEKVPEGKELIRPEPGFVVKTHKTMGDKAESEKLFVNIVQSTNIAEPTKSNTPKGECWSLPYSLGPPHMEKDKKGDNAPCFDCCFHPMALQLGNINTAFRNMLINTAMDGVEESYKRQGHKVNLDRSFHIVKGLSYKEGKVPTMLVATTSKEAWKGDSKSSAKSTSASAASSSSSSSFSKSPTNPPAKVAKDTSSTTEVVSEPNSAAKSKTVVKGKRETTPAIKKGFLNSAKTGIYDDKIQTIRPKASPNALGENTNALLSAASASASATINGNNNLPNNVPEEEVAKLLEQLNLAEKSALQNSTSSAASSVASTVAKESESSGPLMKAVSTRSRSTTATISATVSTASAVVTTSSDSAPSSSTSKVNEFNVPTKLPPTAPKVVLKHREDVSLGDFGGLQSTPVSNRPKELVYEIQLPMVTTPSKIILDVSERRLCLRYAEVYALDMALPYPVLKDKRKAAFDKTKKALVVTLAVEQVSIQQQQGGRNGSSLVEEVVSESSATSSAITTPAAESGSVDDESTTSTTSTVQKSKIATRSSKKTATDVQQHNRWVDKSATSPASSASRSDTSDTTPAAVDESKKLLQEVLAGAERAKQEALLSAANPTTTNKKTSKKDSSHTTNTPPPQTVTAALDAEEAAADRRCEGRTYIPSVKFTGRRVGYVFHLGDQGLGYYLDPQQQPQSAATNVSGPIDVTAKTGSAIIRQRIPCQVQQNPTSVAFLLQVPHVLVDSVQVQVRSNNEVAVIFDALSEAPPTSSTPTSPSKHHYGALFVLDTERCPGGFEITSSNSASNTGTSSVTYDVAAQNMVLLVKKAQVGSVFVESTSSAATVDISALPSWLQVQSLHAIESVSEAQSRTLTSATPSDIPSKSASTIPSVSTSPTVTSGLVSTTTKALLSSLQFSSALLTELD